MMDYNSLKEQKNPNSQINKLIERIKKLQYSMYI